MPTFEEICQKVFADKQLGSKLLIGGLISFVPLVNLIVLGYFCRYAGNVHREKDLNLPGWKSLGKRLARYLVDGLVLFILLLIFSCIAGAIGALIVWIARLIFAFFAFQSVFFLPVALAWCLAPPFSLAALYLYQRRGKLEDMLRLDILVSLILASWRHLVLPGLAFTGLMLVGAPLYGFAFFLGFGMLTAYSTVVFLIIEERGEAGLQFE